MTESPFSSDGFYDWILSVPRSEKLPSFLTKDFSVDSIEVGSSLTDISVFPSSFLLKFDGELITVKRIHISTSYSSKLKKVYYLYLSLNPRKCLKRYISYSESIIAVERLKIQLEENFGILSFCLRKVEFCLDFQSGIELTSVKSQNTSFKILTSVGRVLVQECFRRDQNCKESSFVLDLITYGRGKLEEEAMIHPHGSTVRIVRKTGAKELCFFSVKLYDKAKEYGLSDPLIRFEITVFKEMLSILWEKELVLPHYFSEACWTALNSVYQENGTNKKKALIITLRNFFKKLTSKGGRNL